MTKPWHWRSLPLENRTGAEIFAALFLPTTPSGIATLLESPYPNPTKQPQLSRYSICAGAPRIVDGVPQMWTPQLGKVFPFLEELLQSRGVGEQILNSSSSPLPPAPCLPPNLPFTGGWLGWLGYDVAWEIEQLPFAKSDTLPFPVAFWYEPESYAVLDHVEQILWIAGSDINDVDRLKILLEEKKSGDSLYQVTASQDQPISFAPEFFTSQSDYETSVNRAKKYIQAGDIFQANLSLRFAASTNASGWSIYQTLQKINPSPFASYWQTPWGEVVSCSPERLVLLQNQQAQTRPIAGTRSRGTTPEQDNQLAQELLSNTKEQAEHIMLLDLERNDLGRVCEWGTVKVDELLTIERYSHVMHLVSNVKGTLKSDQSAVDLIRAMFPGGTITGCPKVRCMEIIEELEPVRRSLFYGSCGYLDWRGNLDLNILIRTLLLAPASSVEGQRAEGRGQKAGKESLTQHGLNAPLPLTALNTVWGQVGAGIVADSDPEKEWYESLHKAQAQLAALKILNYQ
ncbi:para-aminobenzoate synthase component I [Anabaenopsis circularis NIES-21]|uniref:Anthranilate synthase component 1 n=2 Tax=Nostocales TaxID=1161 RepID=A0A1Z4GJT6_9CYAN|nr:anthranilate synthase component I [Nostoc cycadae]BAY17767.1 para-aminobenzoate synthase component I [Anabaenopsis circularis NIES-21]GBE91324.1 aminodeoxychorismate synthase, component I, clade 2 [Nostoc cycadae WK-1]